MHRTAIPTFQLKAIPAWPILAACAVAAFSPAFQGTILSWDDQTYLADSAIQSTSCFWERLGWIFSTSYFGNYNPLHRVGYWIQLSLWGRDPAPLHAVSVALHVANVLLVHALVRRLNFTVPVAFLTALLFAVHPSRAEVVAWISAQKDLGSTSLALIALCMYAPFLTGRPSRPIARHLAVAVFFLLALLYKSMIVTLPLVLFGLDLAWRRPPGRAFIEKLPLLAISAAFSLWTIDAAPRVGPVGGSWESHIATMLKAPWAYLERILWPLDYSARWWIAREGGALSALSLAGLCCLLGGVLLLIIMLRSPHRRSAILWLWWPAACILPVSNLLPIPIEVADRYLYLALLGPLLAAASWCGGSGTASAARPLGCLAAALLFALLSWRHAGAFRDAETVWRVSLEAQPDNPVARLHLANELLANDRPSEALSLLGALHRDVLDRQECMVARAEALELLGRSIEADAELDRALAEGLRERLRPKTAVAEARRLTRKGAFEKAHEILSRCSPRWSCEEKEIVDAHAEVSLAAGDQAGYLRWNARQLEASPFSLVLWNNREMVARRLGLSEEAARCAERFEELRG